MAEWFLSDDVNNIRGFTLIEVAVALGILAVVALVAVKASALYTRAYERAEQRMLAQFVAGNARHHYMIYGTNLIGSDRQEVSYAGRYWHVYYAPASQALLADVMGRSSADALPLKMSHTQAILRIYVTQAGSEQVLADDVFVHFGHAP